MLRSKTKLFSRGDQVICIHDIEELGMGDRLTVYDVCDGCLGLMFQGQELHYQDTNFEKYNEEKSFFFQKDPDMIEKQKVANIMTDFIKVMMMNSHRGVFNVDAAMHCIQHNLKLLGIENEFGAALNNPFNSKEGEK